VCVYNRKVDYHYVFVLFFVTAQGRGEGGQEAMPSGILLGESGLPSSMALRIMPRSSKPAQVRYIYG